jgi:hypothetical protein
VGRNCRSLNTATMCQSSVLDEFLDFLLPDLLTEGISTHDKLNKWLQCGKRWTKLVGRYGSGILLLMPSNITYDEWVLHTQVTLTSGRIMTLANHRFLNIHLLIIDALVGKSRFLHAISHVRH